MSGGLFKTTLNGVELVATEEDIYHFMHVWGNDTLVWGGRVEVDKSGYFDRVLFFAHDNLQEQNRVIYAVRKEDLPAVYKMITNIEEFDVSFGYVDEAVKLLELYVHVLEID